MKAKIVILMLLVIFLTIFISQNAVDLPVKVLFWEIEIPGIILILLTGLLGIIIGFILALIFKKPSEKKIEPAKNTIRTKRSQTRYKINYITNLYCPPYQCCSTSHFI